MDQFKCFISSFFTDIAYHHFSAFCSIKDCDLTADTGAGPGKNGYFFSRIFIVQIYKKLKRDPSSLPGYLFKVRSLTMKGIDESHLLR